MITITQPGEIAVTVGQPDAIVAQVSQPAEIVVVTAAEQGPPGPPGPMAEGIRKITASPTPPENPQVGDCWIDTSY